MYPAQFEYSKAGSVAEAIQILQGDPDAKIIAGGHSLIPLMKLRLARPSRVVDIGGIAELRGISVSGGVVSIGALTTHHEIATSADVQANCGILAEAAGGVGDPAVRNRGTIGGNVSHADPASDLPTVLTALGASFNVQGAVGAALHRCRRLLHRPLRDCGRRRRGADRRQRSGAGRQPGWPSTPRWPIRPRPLPSSARRQW